MNALMVSRNRSITAQTESTLPCDAWPGPVDDGAGVQLLELFAVVALLVSRNIVFASPLAGSRHEARAA